MTRRVTGVSLVLLALFSLPVLGAEPAPGTYTSVDIGFGSQDVLTGRGSNSRPVPDQGVDNVFNAKSWDGAALGTQWIFTCGISVSQVVDNNLDMNGNGTIVFTTEYGGGTFWFSKDGPWGDSVNDLTGTINDLTRITTLQYVAGNPVAAVENVNTNGEFDDSNCVLRFVINNNVGLGDTDSNPPLPADYPPFLDLNCGATRNDGSWGDVRDIVLDIFCPVPVEETSWGHVKSMYE